MCNYWKFREVEYCGGYGFGQSEWKGKQNYIPVAMMCACGFNFFQLEIILYVMCVTHSFVCWGLYGFDWKINQSWNCSNSWFTIWSADVIPDCFNFSVSILISSSVQLSEYFLHIKHLDAVFLVIQLVLNSRVMPAYHCALPRETKEQDQWEVQIEATDGSNKLHWSFLWCQSVPKGFHGGYWSDESLLLGFCTK